MLRRIDKVSEGRRTERPHEIHIICMIDQVLIVPKIDHGLELDIEIRVALLFIVFQKRQQIIAVL